MKKDQPLGRLRRKIVKIDEELVNLLHKRLKIAQEIGKYKRKHELPIEDPHIEMQKRRERESMLKKLDKENAPNIEAIFKTIIQVARGVQRRDALAHMQLSAKHNGNKSSDLKRIAIMGSGGSFTEDAALTYCKSNGIKKHLFYYPVSAEGVLHLLEVEQADIGIFPIYNSVGGIVYESIYAASEHVFLIDTIFGFDVQQCLMALPGTKVADIKTVMSHPQALAQCAGYLRENFPRAKLVEASDTATSAKYLSVTAKKKDVAVIAPMRCAKLYDLDLLAKGIQDQKKNVTYFIAAMK